MSDARRKEGRDESHERAAPRSADMFIRGDGGAVGGAEPSRGEDKIWGAGGSPPVASALE